MLYVYLGFWMKNNLFYITPVKSYYNFEVKLA